METIKLDIPTGITQLVEYYEKEVRWSEWKMQSNASYGAFLRMNEDSKRELGVTHYLRITSIRKDKMSGHYEAYDISEIKDIDEVNHRGEDLFVHFMRLDSAINICNHSFVVKLHKDSYQHWNFYRRDW